MWLCAPVQRGSPLSNEEAEQISQLSVALGGQGRDLKGTFRPRPVLFCTSTKASGPPSLSTGLPGLGVPPRVLGHPRGIGKDGFSLDKCYLLWGYVSWCVRSG